MSKPLLPNRFRKTLEHGDFLFLGEVRSPGRELDKDVAGEKIAAFEKSILEAQGIFTALAVSDGGSSANFYRAAEFAEVLSPENRDRHLFYLSGRNLDLQEAESVTEKAC